MHQATEDKVSAVAHALAVKAGKKRGRSSAIKAAIVIKDPDSQAGFLENVKANRNLIVGGGMSRGISIYELRLTIELQKTLTAGFHGLRGFLKHCFEN